MKLIKVIISVALAIILSTLGSVWVAALSAEEITAPSAVLMEAQSGKLLYDKDAHQVRPCASITKVMTLLLTFEAIENGKLSLTDTLTASAHAASMGGSDIWLEEGETMSADDLIKATVVASANDAAVVLAETISGSEETFVEEMNKKAKELGMNETVFKNCNGLDEDGHVTSAYDVAVMSRELIKHKDIFNYCTIWMDSLRGGKTQIVNTNKLLKTYTGITGLKTGTTSQAGSCISATATRDSMSLVAVVLGSATGKERFTDAAKLLDYGFAGFTAIAPTPPEEGFLPQTVINGMSNTVNLTANLEDSILIEKGNEKKVEYNINYEQNIEAPVKMGQTLGTIEYTLDDKPLASYPITAECDVEKIDFWPVFSIFVSTLLQL